MMALWGLTIIATFSEGSLLKGLIATSLGIMIAYVGMDPVSGTPRFWFGNVYLLDGISFPVAMIGLFAVAEMIKLYVKGGAIVDRVPGDEKSSVFDGVRDALQHWWLILRSSLPGLWIGVLPGVGASVGGIAASASSPTKSETPPGSAEDNIDRIWNGYGTESGLPDYDYLSGGWRTNAEEDE